MYPSFCPFIFITICPLLLLPNYIYIYNRNHWKIFNFRLLIIGQNIFIYISIYIYKTCVHVTLGQTGWIRIFRTSRTHWQKYIKKREATWHIGLTESHNFLHWELESRGRSVTTFRVYRFSTRVLLIVCMCVCVCGCERSGKWSCEGVRLQAYTCLLSPDNHQIRRERKKCKFTRDFFFDREELN